MEIWDDFDLYVLMSGLPDVTNGDLKILSV